MDLLQKELDEISGMWNIHLIRYTRSPLHISGIRDELYHVPGVQGMASLLLFTYLICHTGFRDYKCAADDGDLRFCRQHAKSKPSPVPLEFIDLAHIIMQENQWSMPSNCQESLTLYLDLKNTIEQSI